MMIKVTSIFLISLIILFGVSSAFSQCGADGTQPCNPLPPKKTVPKQTKPPVSKPITPKTTKTTISTKKPQTIVNKTKPQTNFVPRVPDIELVKIPAGSFMMKYDTGLVDSNKWAIIKKRRVNVSQFLIGKYEVTQTQWKSVMGSNPSDFPRCGGNCPVENVSWDDTKKFINKLNSLQSNYEYRLPSGEEWEYAYRAGNDTDSPMNPNYYDWLWENADNMPHRVGQKPANKFGLFDMGGNVEELVEDSCDSDFQQGVKLQFGGHFATKAEDLEFYAITTCFPQYQADFGRGFRVVATLR
jgi:formylglycine-generating enzyme required for sulfatase activity